MGGFYHYRKLKSKMENGGYVMEVIKEVIIGGRVYEIIKDWRYYSIRRKGSKSPYYPCRGTFEDIELELKNMRMNARDEKIRRKRRDYYDVDFSTSYRMADIMEAYKEYTDNIDF